MTHGGVAQQLLQRRGGPHHAAMEVKRVRVERETLAAAVAGVVQNPLMKGQDHLAAQHVVGRVGGLAAEQLDEGRGVLHVVAEPHRLAAALLLHAGLQLQLADKFPERRLGPRVQVLADVAEQVELAHAVRHGTVPGRVAGGRHGVAQIVEHLAGSSESLCTARRQGTRSSAFSLAIFQASRQMRLSASRRPKYMGVPGSTVASISHVVRPRCWNNSRRRGAAYWRCQWPR